MSAADRVQALDAMVDAARALGWYAASAQSSADRIVLTVTPIERDRRPHSRACGMAPHDHGHACAPDCPTCGGSQWPVLPDNLLR